MMAVTDNVQSLRWVQFGSLRHCVCDLILAARHRREFF